MQMHSLQGTDSIPNVAYTLYVYSSGEGERFRTVFVKDQESAVEVVPMSTKIKKMGGTFGDAMRFMESGAGYIDVDVQSVTFNGKVVGYLLTQSVEAALQRQMVDVNVYERGGRIYFGATDVIDDSMD